MEKGMSTTENTFVLTVGETDGHGSVRVGKLEGLEAK